MPAEINEILRVLSPIFQSTYHAAVVFRDYAFQKFGQAGGMALTALLIITALAVVIRILRLLFDLLRYVVLPSAAVSGLLVMVTPMPFLFVFPISTAIFGVLLLIKS